MSRSRESREPLDEQGFVPPAELRGDIKFEHVGFAYDAATPVVKEVTFHCRPGQVIALLGATGSGKTSLVNLLPRFYDYTDGRLLLDGRELRSFARRYLRQNIGLVEQEPFLFSRSIRENIGYGTSRPVVAAVIEEDAKAAPIHETILHFPQATERHVLD